MADDPERAVARKKALDLLSYREHSAHQMREKLRARGFENHHIDDVLDYLVSNNYLSDERFAEMFVRHRVGRGFGELDVSARLRERGVAAALVSKVLREFSLEWESNWEQHAIEVLERKSAKIGASKIGSDKTGSGAKGKMLEAERARLVRFMSARGFTTAQTIVALKCCAEVES